MPYKELVVILLLIQSFASIAQEETRPCHNNDTINVRNMKKGLENGYIYYTNDNSHYLLTDEKGWGEDSLVIFENLFTTGIINCKLIVCTTSRTCNRPSPYIVKKKLLLKDTIYDNPIFPSRKTTQFRIYHIRPLPQLNGNHKMNFRISGNFYSKPEPCFWDFELTLPQASFQYGIQDFIKYGKLACIEQVYCEL